MSVVPHACNHSTEQAEARGFLQVLGHPGLKYLSQNKPDLHIETLCKI